MRWYHRLGQWGWGSRIGAILSLTLALHPASAAVDGSSSQLLDRDRVEMLVQARAESQRDCQPVLFARCVHRHFTEEDLALMLESSRAEVRLAALEGLALLGTMQSNPSVAVRFRDPDPRVASTACRVAWKLWYRGAEEPLARRLQQILEESPGVDPNVTLSKLNVLIQDAPDFAEAYNQRAMVFFRMARWRASILDCQSAIRLNPHHFGARGGLALCHEILQEWEEALIAYEDLERIRPGCEHIQDRIADLRSLIARSPADHSSATDGLGGG